MLVKNTLYIGLNDKDTKIQKIETLECYKIVSNILLNNNIDGATIFSAMGIYKHDNGEIVTENTLRVELINADKKAVEKSINAIKTALNQENVILQTEKITSSFI